MNLDSFYRLVRADYPFSYTWLATLYVGGLIARGSCFINNICDDLNYNQWVSAISIVTTCGMLQYGVCRIRRLNIPKRLIFWIPYVITIIGWTVLTSFFPTFYLREDYIPTHLTVFWIFIIYSIFVFVLHVILCIRSSCAGRCLYFLLITLISVMNLINILWKRDQYYFAIHHWFITLFLSLFSQFDNRLSIFVFAVHTGGFIHGAMVYGPDPFKQSR